MVVSSSIDARFRAAAVPRAAAGALERPLVAVDIVPFALAGGRLLTCLGQIAAGALAGKWAFPGGLVRVGENLDGAARRELAASTGVRGAYLEQLFTFGDPSRDPRTHVVSVAYIGLIAEPATSASAAGKYARLRWFGVSALPALAYDHGQMAEHAVKRLKARLGYTNIACNLLPPAFTFAQLEEVYSVVLGRTPDRRNFRRRIMAMGILRRLDAKRRGPHRPATLYRFERRSLQMIELL